MRKLNLAHSRRHTPATPAAPPAGTSTLKELSAAASKAVNGIRDDFSAFVDGFISLESDRAAFAPKFMRAFEVWAKDTEGNFVGFVRQLDPKVPEDRDGYRAHTTYQAADYLRRLNAQTNRDAREVPEDERPVSLNTALIYLVATVMPLVDPTGSIFSAFAKEMHWDAEQQERIKVRAAKLGAVKLPPRIKHNLESRRAA